jgi:hypothetical protein
MSPQMTTVEVDRDTAEILQALQEKAEAQGVTLGALLRPLIEKLSSPGEEKPFYETATPEERAKAYLDWANSHDPTIPPLSLADMSHESIHEDR